MARSIKTLRWYELGFWTYAPANEGGTEWHVVASYETVALAEEDAPKAQANWPLETFVVRHKRVEVVIG